MEKIIDIPENDWAALPEGFAERLLRGAAGMIRRRGTEAIEGILAFMECGTAWEPSGSERAVIEAMRRHSGGLGPHLSESAKWHICNGIPDPAGMDVIDALLGHEGLMREWLSLRRMRPDDAAAYALRVAGGEDVRPGMDIDAAFRKMSLAGKRKCAALLRETAESGKKVCEMTKDEMARRMAVGMLDEYENYMDLLEREGRGDERDDLAAVSIPTEGELAEQASRFLDAVEGKADISGLDEDDIADIAAAAFHFAIAREGVFRSVSVEMGMPEDLIPVLDDAMAVFDFSPKGKPAAAPERKAGRGRKNA